jgi:enoyl-CoA hydratase/carnithine racemase
MVIMLTQRNRSSSQAMQMILLGTPITAAEASAAGLVADVFEPGSVLENVLQTASKLASMSPSALSLAKEAVCRCTATQVPVSATSHPAPSRPALSCTSDFPRLQLANAI